MSKFYCKTTRDMFSHIEEVGAKPFALFLYYLTFQTAKEIRPTLDQTAKDFNSTKKAIWNLKKVLIDAKWISEDNGKILILKSFESHPEKMDAHPEKMDAHPEKMDDIYRNKNNQERTLEETIERTEEESYFPDNVEEEPPSDKFQSSVRNVFLNQETALMRRNDDADCEALMLFEQTFRVKAGNHTAETIKSLITDLDVWRELLLEKSAYADFSDYERRKVSTWIFSAYQERVVKKQKETIKNGKENPGRTERERIAIEDGQFFNNLSERVAARRKELLSRGDA